MTNFKAVAVLFGTVVLAGCAGTQLQKAEGLAPKGDAFAKYLYQDYLSIAKEEYAEADYGNSDYFALKAMKSSEGARVLPQEVGERQLPKNRVPVLSGARDRLMTALNGGAGDKWPELAARAQAMYDCWLEEESEPNRQQKDINECRDAFIVAMEKIEAAMKPAPMMKKPMMKKTMMKKPVKKAEPMAPKPKGWIIYFDFNSDKLTPAGMAKVREVAKYAGTKMFVTVRGHADRAGSDSYNAKLAERRAEAVAFALMDAGVPALKIRMNSLGEKEPAVVTPDGKREALNRRVTITVTVK